MTQILIILANFMIVSCSRAPYETGRIQKQNIIIDTTFVYDTLQYTTYLNDTITINKQKTIITYDTIKNRLIIKEIQRTPVISKIVKDTIKIIERTPRKIIYKEANGKSWLFWLVLGAVAMLLLFIILRK